MADNDKKNTGLPEESVDDILAGILNSDGSFNDEFNGLFAKYFVGNAQEIKVPDVDLSDRSGEELPKEKIAYDSGEFGSVREKTADERIEEKMPESIRELYSEASSEAQRPEFTSTGDVKYPSMGVGASEQRVVFDADWEETAKKEAQRLERVRQDRLLRGDSAYSRTFIAGGMYLPQQNQYVQNPNANPLYIDPLSRDEDFENPNQNSQYYSSQKKSFFPEGFSVVPKSNVAAGGKTVKRNSGNRYENTRSNADMSWLQVEEKAEKKKKKLFDRKKEKASVLSESPVIPGLDEKAQDSQEDAAASAQEDAAVRVPVYAPEELEEAAEEAAGLRTTVAQIVDKYNKRNEEDELRRREELARLEEKRREEELRERRREEELRLLKQELSPELVDAMEDDGDDFFGEYEDFSTEPSEKPERTEEVKPSRAFGVVFDPEAISGSDYLEKLTDEASVRENAEDEKNAEETAAEEKSNKNRKKPIFQSRRKDS